MIWETSTVLLPEIQSIDALCLRIIIEDRLRDLDAGEYIEHEEVKKQLLQT